ncbi:hypothetical protein ABEH87_11385 [Erwinia sp. Eh17-17]|uniref:hypothetical protein n=1 Tax=Erwinia sp. Eh17-17 TaxID=3080330 RepID=UPI00320B6555
MANTQSSDLPQKIKQTERAISGVVEVLGDKKIPPAAYSMPVPSPATAVHDHPENPDSEKQDGAESDTNEIQDAWLASLDKKTNDLNICLKQIQSSLRTLSKNVNSLEAEARVKHAEADGVLADNVLRKEMADKTYGFMVIWCFFIAMLIASYVIAYEGKPPLNFMLGLLGTCTISIIGLVGFVVSGLFKASPKGGSK